MTKSPVYGTFSSWMRAHIKRSGAIIPSVSGAPPLPAIPKWCKELPLDERTMECGLIKWIITQPKLLRWMKWWLTYSKLMVPHGDKWVFNPNWDATFDESKLRAVEARRESNNKKKDRRGGKRMFSPRMLLELKPKNPKTVAEWQREVSAQTTMSQRTFYLLKSKLPPKQQALDYQLPQPPEEPPRYETLNPKPKINFPELMKQINHEHSSPTH